MSYLFDTNACIHLMKLHEPLTATRGIRAHLTAKGRLIGDRDLMIAAIAQANRLTVVTSNVGKFSRVPGLKVEDWME